MNIALPALVIFALLLPGFIFRHSYKLTEKTLLDFKPFGESTIKSVLAAFCLDALWATIAPPVFGYYVDFANLLALLTGSGQPDSFARALRQTNENARPIFCFFLGLYVFSWFSGRLLRLAIQEKRLDCRDNFLHHLFRFETPWFYLFNAYDEESYPPDGVYIAAVVDIDGGPYLFVGVLQEYFFKENGDLDRLVLSSVSRRKLHEDKIIGSQKPSNDSERNQESSVTAASPDERYYPIAGDYFVLKYDEIVTLNISYVYLRPQSNVAISAPS